MSDRELLARLITIPIFLISLSIHEYAHGWMAYRYGDDTAARMGRLTLNPLAHISLFGTIILPLLIHFGWAKPVPVNFSILSKRQIFMVAAAGPLANISLAVVLAVAFHVLGLSTMSLLGNFILWAILINIVLAVFNLIPIPPLDGSWILSAALKGRAKETYEKLRPYSIFLFLGLIFTSILDYIMVIPALLVWGFVALAFSAIGFH